MGKLKFWWKIAEFVAPNTLARIVDVPIKVIDSTLKTMDEGAQNKVKKYGNTQSNHTRLILEPDLNSRTEYYSVYDDNRCLKYTVKGKFFSLKHHLLIFDAQGVEIGKIKEALIAFRLPSSHNYKPVTFKIFVAGKKLGKIKSKHSFLKTFYVVKFKKWKIVRDSLGVKYDVYNRDKVIMMVTQTVASGKNNVLFVDIFEEKMELMGLIIGIVVDSIAVSKGERLRRVRTNFLWLF